MSGVQARASRRRPGSFFGDIDMPANAVDQANDTDVTGSDSKRLAAEAQRTFIEARAKIEQVVQEGLEQLRAHSRTYADTAGQQLDVAQQYVSERVKERPLAATGAALGVGVLIGLLLSSGRR
jgi:ElaB/YqjD/DUF883 family membrane-anchored ribosome-binding protein